MRATQFATGVSLGFFLVTACARLAAAQTYVWTDDHGVVHAASDPSEVPAKQREKAMRDAIGRRSGVTITPTDDDAVPAAPSPVAPESPRRAPEPATRPYEGDAPGMNGGGVGVEANPQVTPRAKHDEPAANKYRGNQLPPPDPGFEWNCATDPEGGPPKCEQFEKRNNRRDRRAAARQAARDALGVSDPTEEFDPDVAKKVERRAEEEFKKSTPVPTTKAPKAAEEDPSYGESSDEPDEQEE
ncbi:MAG TPA: hypothetical protein VKF60_07385 [Myxococcota bacterium]|nr:hypothetical protein [Myxococcota bacterium]